MTRLFIDGDNDKIAIFFQHIIHDCPIIGGKGALIPFPFQIHELVCFYDNQNRKRGLLRYSYPAIYKGSNTFDQYIHDQYKKSAVPESKKYDRDIEKVTGELHLAFAGKEPYVEIEAFVHEILLAQKDKFKIEQDTDTYCSPKGVYARHISGHMIYKC